MSLPVGIYGPWVSYSRPLIVLKSFKDRHIGLSSEAQDEMLAELGYDCLESFIEDVVPNSIFDPERLGGALYSYSGTSEEEALNEISKIAYENKPIVNYIGQGYYGTFTPSVIKRNILENPAWYTAYTPYQPEISQGRLEALLNFQTMVSDLTALPIANASLLDEGTAAAEAMLVMYRSAKNKSKTCFISKYLHPQTIEVLKTRATPLGIDLEIGDEFDGFGNCFGVILQYPRTNGAIYDYSEEVQKAHGLGALVAVATDLLALTLLKPPGEWGADIAFGNSQRFGVPMAFGGPHAAFFAVNENLKRAIPGRLVGVSVDAQGAPALRLAMQTREQHIRREKATSNICTAQALLAIMASMYAVYHGPDNLRNIALQIFQATDDFAKYLTKIGYKVLTKRYFDTISIDCPWAQDLVADLAKEGANIRLVDSKTVSVSFDEVNWLDGYSLGELFFESAKKYGKNYLFPLNENATLNSGNESANQVFNNKLGHLVRTSKFLSHSIFNTYHSETQLMRYMRKLSDKDLALDRTMIPLGSCTMKLNSASSMIPITMSEFANMHPFAPNEQATGYGTLIDRLTNLMKMVTGYDAFSFQPNSGAAGEYAGLLTIRAYHEANGEGHRNICLIPASAHGTNPASAAMAGYQVVIINTTKDGYVDVDDLRDKLNEMGAQVAALMITYPSTHGVFEDNIIQICDLVHMAGAQVYLDGANMNAMVGLAAPGLFGSDVSHFNLHKTFGIPHGGGGPGVGPIGVKKHLAPYLPGILNERGVLTDSDEPGPVSSAPFGSAGILPISYMYLNMLGSQGCILSSICAILNANYIAHKLEGYYPILYTDKKGFVAHECIIDLRPIKDSCGVTVDDVAKRLMDYGFHAPTMSFPVPGTLMIEPTESEDLGEIERFINAMIQIRKEIAQIESGAADSTDNLLKNAPHTAQMIASDDWTHPYSRQEAAFPEGVDPETKYWCPVARVDNAYGDRNLICTCPPMEAYK